MTKNKQFELICGFNDLLLNELGLFADEHGNVLKQVSETDACRAIIKDKPLIYCETIDEYAIINKSVVKMNPLVNKNLMEILAYNEIQMLLAARMQQLYATGFVQIPGSRRVKYQIQYRDQNGVVGSYESSPYYNEAVCIFEILCGLNGSRGLYTTHNIFEKFNVSVEEFKI